MMCRGRASELGEGVAGPRPAQVSPGPHRVPALGRGRRTGWAVDPARTFSELGFRSVGCMCVSLLPGV